MAKKNIITLPVTSQQWKKEWTDLQDYFHQLTYADTFKRIDNRPFVIWHDEKIGVYRFFPDEEKRDAWIDAYLNDEMTPEIAEYEFADPITAPAPYVINIAVANDNKYILEGTEGVTLDFTFETRDGNQSVVPESVDVYYTFQSPSGTKTTAAVYSANTNVSMNVDKYISLGKNTIAITIKGRATGASKTVVATYTMVKLSLSSTFQIARSIEQNTPFNVTYNVQGDGDKTVKFYIDGVLNSNESISSLEPNATKVKRINGLTAGKHTLQMVAEMQMGQQLFRSKLLYYEFIVKGSELTTTVISEQFSNTQEIFVGSTPGIYGEQYVIKEINWAYFSSNNQMYHATIQWRLYTEGGVETPIATRTADIVEAESDTPPEPLRFMPTETGVYHLQALIGTTVIGDYTISIIQNTSGIQESTNGMTMKLSGLGRDNSEPEETLDSWVSKIGELEYSTTFTNQPWNGNSGWNDNALVLNGGATAVINNKPYAAEILRAGNGCVFEIDFETFNVDDENAIVLQIGNLGTAQLIITSNKAVLKSGFGRMLVSRFKSDERVKICYVVYPNTGVDYARKMFVYVNGVMSGVEQYELADSFVIGSFADSESQVGMINLGSASGNAGIKIYYIRTYSNTISMYDELNNYFIDSGENIQYLVDDNDIYAAGTRIIDVDKLEGTITTVKFTGPLNELINQGSGKHSATCAMEVTNPQNSNINIYCDKAQVSNAGQSTLDKPVPSFHVKLDKNGNVCFNRDGIPYSKNRWAFREGNIPEKKFRLQANYMDSSGCHNGAFLRLFNEVSSKVRINGQDVLRIPSKRYAEEEYASDMRDIHGEDPSGNNWKFPYTINMVPDSIPCIVIWRPDDQSAYRFLGQYVIMEEKKANYANGMHSIYSGLDANGLPDPFGFKSSKEGTRLWDNKDCHQFEFLRSTGDLELFLDDSDWSNEKENSFELIYPDEDDLTPEEITAEWNKYYNDVVKPICDSYGDTSEFSDLIYGSHPKIDRWHLAAYYCLAMRNACTDSMVRNMELVTYDGNIWLPKWWDVDMQCGLQQTGECNIVPTSTRDTLAPGKTDAYAFSGRLIVDGTMKSSWFWDALTGNDELGIEPNEYFLQDVKAMDDALYKAGWKYTQMTQLQDQEYIDAWSNALYNESSVSKYIAYNDLESLQGDRTPHRHWFLRTSYDYFDALNVCGEYTSKLISIRTQSISPGSKIYFTADSTSYFGWGYTNNVVQSGIEVEKGDDGILTIDRTLALNDPLHIYAANKIAAIDMNEISEHIAGADIDFSGTYDDLLGSRLKDLNIGVTKTRMNQGVFNTSTSATQIQGIDTLSRLEKLNIQGMQYFVGLDMSAMSQLKYFYAAGSGLDSFNPANGSDFVEVELPTSVTSIQMDGCNLTYNNSCAIDWYETIYSSGTPIEIQAATIPSTLRVMILSGMGSDLGTKILILDWLNAVYDDLGDAGLANLELTCRNVNWTDVDVDDLLLLAKIPSVSRNVTGYIKCSGTLTTEDVVAILNAFGQDVFTDNPGVSLRVDADAGFVLNVPALILAGNSYNVSAVSFPISSGSGTITYSMGHYVDNIFQNDIIPVTINGYTYYQLTDTVNGEVVTLASLCKETGEFVTYENSSVSGDYNIGIKGTNGESADDTPLTIKKRVYPSSIDFDVEYPTGKNVSYDSGTNQWYVTSDNFDLTINIETDPEEITGTVIPNGSVWNVSQDILTAFGLYAHSDDSITIRIPENGVQTLVIGTIKHTKTYVGGYSKTIEYVFRFKSPAVVITNAANSVLQTALYSNGVASEATRTYDTEAWVVTDLDDLGVFASGSQLVHLAEINEFPNLEMTTLNLSNCTLFGGVSTLYDLENGVQDYVNVLPRKQLTLDHEFEEINMANTRLTGVNLKLNSNVLESITYSAYTEDIILQGQSSLNELNIEFGAINNLDSIVIENCNSLEEITWI